MKRSKLVLLLILLLSFLLLGPHLYGQDMKKIAKDAYKELCKNLDKNKDGKLSKEEYMKMWKDKKKGEQEFKKWDTNKDGYITEEEYVNAVGNISKKSKNQSSVDIIVS